MPSGNFDEPVTATPAQTEPPRAFRWPADYYSTPVSDVRPIFPRWVALGCGTAAAVFLVVLFVGGAFVAPHLPEIADMFLGTTLGELRGMYAPDVTAPEKARFEDEVKQLREEMRANKVSLQNVQPFLKSVASTMRDKKVTAQEVEQLTKSAHDARAKSKVAP